ncbi:MAG: response regulator [bacterium]
MAKDRPFIIIAERDPFMRDILKKALEERFDLEFVEDGAEVMERVRASKPALVILEVLLPTLDGFQVCQRLKNDPSTCRIPVLFFTLLLAEERAYQVGADGFLLKPFRKDALMGAIDRLMATSSSNEEEKD